MTDAETLAEIEDLIRTSPKPGTMARQDDETLDWLGRAEATFYGLGASLSVQMGVAVAALNTVYAVPAAKAEGDVRRLLRTARWTYRQRTGGPTSLAVDAGMVFDYFNGVSKIIETARKDILFIDPYLDASFVERYLSFIDGAVPVRLLGREKQATLIPAAQAFAKQYGRSVEVRSASNFHDRFVFIDQFQCFQSGASFKDGANRTPTTLTEITDAFAEVQKTYEALWGAAKVDFKS